ncbi:MFS transporter [Ramlibacter algicola]|uniref:MFS transporter n=1 Tax=Ramlibacter algicola TaxID=2795217 RepID=A0A934USK3_9BURK|nr:MFS transporter [Ramlibacter algicola]MBK0393818.1 MFS transporter [Ramlibacter algicola]
MPPRARTVAVLGTAQTLAWASTYYLPAILAVPIARDLGTSVPTVFGAFSLALIVSALLGPHSGRAIDHWGGRPVLSVTSIVFAAGLALLGFAQSTAVMFIAWTLLGVGMGAGLYEGGFATLVRLYGKDSRSAITGITLIAGFASTVGWPLSAWMSTTYGWREACFAWAALHLVLGLPLNLSLPQAEPPKPAEPGAVVDDAPEVPMRSVVLLSFVFAATWFVSTAMAAHLPRLVMAAGATLATAVAVGAMIGPSQVAARLLEFGFLSRIHPLLSGRLAAGLHPLGVAVLALFGAPAAMVFGILHGAGNGILTIAKGTLPLALFGPAGYGHRQGLLTVPARIAQAFAPWLFGVCIDRWGAGALVVSAGMSIAALVALLALKPTQAREQRATAGS